MTITPTGKNFLVFFILAVMAGCIIGWIDSRPNWDDTGITVVLVMLSSVGLGWVFPRYFWLWGFIIGGIIVGLNVVVSNNYQSIAALVIALFGSGIGALIAKSISPDTPTIS